MKDLTISFPNHTQIQSPLLEKKKNLLINIMKAVLHIAAIVVAVIVLFAEGIVVAIYILNLFVVYQL